MQRRSLVTAALALAAAGGALAQAPAKPIRLIVPYAPGGPIDVTARALAERVQAPLGTIVVENNGKAFYSSLEGLGEFVFRDYKTNKSKRSR